MEFKSGVKRGKGKYDWIAGSNSPIDRTVLLPDLKWKPYLSKQEIQFETEFSYDTLFCATYSALKSIASMFNYYIRHNLMPAEDLAFLQDYMVNGEINFNERFTGTLGDTDQHGAYQYKIANAIKNFGLIPQDMFPMADNFYDNIDKKFITDEMFAKGRAFMERFYINYEWITDVRDALKYSPVQMIVKFMNYSSPNDILKPVGTFNHAVAGIYSVKEYNEIADTYWQEFKRYDPDYTASFMSFSLTFLLNNNINMDCIKFLKENDLKFVQNSNSGQFGRIMQGKLMVVQSNDRGTLMLLDDKMRTEPSIKITQAEWQQLETEGFINNF